MRRFGLLGLVLLLAVLTASHVQAQQQSVKIGVLFVTSGPMGGYGKHGFQAVQMAVEEINANGGILGRRVEVVFGDTQLKLPVATEIATRFVSQDRVDFIIGPTSSGIAGVISKIAADNKKILVLAQAAADSLTGSAFSPHQFATLSNAMIHSRSGAYYVASKPYKRWMSIGPNYNYGWDSWAQFKGKLKELRPDVGFVGEVWPKLTEKEFGPFIQKIVEAKPDAVWSPLWGMDAANFNAVNV